MLVDYKRSQYLQRMPSKKEQLQAIDKEITRAKNHIKFIESKLPPDQLREAQAAAAQSTKSLK